MLDQIDLEVTDTSDQIVSSEDAVIIEVKEPHEVSKDQSVVDIAPSFAAPHVADVKILTPIHSKKIKEQSVAPKDVATTIDEPDKQVMDAQTAVDVHFVPDVTADNVTALDLRQLQPNVDLTSAIGSPVVMSSNCATQPIITLDPTEKADYSYKVVTDHTPGEFTNVPAETGDCTEVSSAVTAAVDRVTHQDAQSLSPIRQESLMLATGELIDSKQASTVVIPNVISETHSVIDTEQTSDTLMTSTATPLSDTVQTPAEGADMGAVLTTSTTLIDQVHGVKTGTVEDVISSQSFAIDEISPAGKSNFARTDSSIQILLEDISQQAAQSIAAIETDESASEMAAAVKELPDMQTTPSTVIKMSAEVEQHDLNISELEEQVRKSADVCTVQIQQPKTKIERIISSSIAVGAEEKLNQAKAAAVETTMHSSVVDVRNNQEKPQTSVPVTSTEPVVDEDEVSSASATKVTTKLTINSTELAIFTEQVEKQPISTKVDAEVVSPTRDECQTEKGISVHQPDGIENIVRTMNERTVETIVTRTLDSAESVTTTQVISFGEMVPKRSISKQSILPSMFADETVLPSSTLEDILKVPTTGVQTADEVNQDSLTPLSVEVIRDQPSTISHSSLILESKEILPDYEVKTSQQVTWQKLQVGELKEPEEDIAIEFVPPRETQSVFTIEELHGEALDEVVKDSPAATDTCLLQSPEAGDHVSTDFIMAVEDTPEQRTSSYEGVTPEQGVKLRVDDAYAKHTHDATLSTADLLADEPLPNQLDTYPPLKISKGTTSREEHFNLITLSSSQPEISKALHAESSVPHASVGRLQPTILKQLVDVTAEEGSELILSVAIGGYPDKVKMVHFRRGTTIA